VSSPISDQVQIDITFPLPQSQLGGVSRATVSGTVTSLTGQDIRPSDISEFLVNGQAADVDLASGRWSANIATDGDSLTIEARLATTDGAQATDRISVRNQQDQPYYERLGIPGQDNTVLVYGSSHLRSIDLDTGNERSVRKGLGPSVTGIRIGPANTAYMLREGNDNNVLKGLGVADAVAVDLDGDSTTIVGDLPMATRAWNKYQFSYPDFSVGEQYLAYTFNSNITDHPADDCALGILDLDSGTRTELLRTDSFTIAANATAEGTVDDFVVATSPQPGSPPSYRITAYHHCPGPVVLDERRNRAISAQYIWSAPRGEDDPYPGLYIHDLDTGQFSILADNNTGQGPSLQRPRWLFMRGDGDTVVAVDDQGIYDIDLVSGNRTLLSAFNNWPDVVRDVQFDEHNNRLLHTGAGQEISSVDLSTGTQRQLLSFSRAVGSGPAVRSFAPLIVDERHNRLLSLDWSEHKLVSLDLDTLQRSQSAMQLGDDNRLSNPVLHNSGDYIYYYAIQSHSLRELDLRSGESRLVSQLQPAEPAQIDRPWSMAIDSASDLLYLSFSTGILSVDIVSGNQRAITPPGGTQQESPGRQEFLLYDEKNERLIGVSSSNSVVAIDTDTGRHEQLPGQATGNFLDYVQNLYGVSWDTRDGHILLEGRNIGQHIVTSLNLDSGEFSVVARDRGSLSVHKSANLMFSSQAALSSHEATFEAQDRSTGERAIIVRPE